MLEPFKSPQQIGPPSRRSDPSLIAAVDVLRPMQSKSNRTTIHDLERAERKRLFRNRLLSLWPVVLGLTLGCFAPQLRHALAPSEPWGAWLVFPFAALAGRPELHLSGESSHIIRLIALYAQFPVEGLLMRLMMRNRVTVSGVAREVFLVHFLGAVELCLLSGMAAQLALR